MQSALATRLSALVEHMAHVPLVAAYGAVIDVQGPVVRIAATDLQVGDICRFELPERDLLGEVIGFSDKLCLITPLGGTNGIGPGTLVKRIGPQLSFPFSHALLGQVVSGLGQPLRPIAAKTSWRDVAVSGPGTHAHERALIDRPVVTGIRAIDACLTLAGGQRIMVTGPPGVGKSTLLASITSNVDADVVVFGLIGERGREIDEFVERKLPPALREKVVVVAAPSDRPAMERIHAANVATAIAETFRDEGKSVLLILDSLTRVARAMREVGLAAGEPPTRRGYPASVFARLPELLERAGKTQKGEITAIYAVLSEGDQATDPVVEEVRSLVDGHILLDEKVFASGRFPAIDVTGSLSRLMRDVVGARHLELATKIRQVLTVHEQVELLVQIGEYQRGQDPQTDWALDAYPRVIEFLSQRDPGQMPHEDMLAWMEQVCA